MTEASAPHRLKIAIVSDIHYAGAAERARGNDYESHSIANPLLRIFVRLYRDFIWLRNPLDQAPQLDSFLNKIALVDYLVANGDYSCDSGFVGVSDPAALASAQECIRQTSAQNLAESRSDSPSAIMNWEN